MTVSSFVTAYATLWDLWNKWTQSSDKTLSLLAKAGLNAMEKKQKVWTQTHLLVAAYLDPCQNEKLVNSNCKHIPKSQVYIYKIYLTNINSRFMH